MSGDLCIDIERGEKLYRVNFEEAPVDEETIDVRCPNCDSLRIIEHRIELDEVDIYLLETLEPINNDSNLGRELLALATAKANSHRDKPYTCDDCQHNFH